MAFAERLSTLALTGYTVIFDALGTQATMVQVLKDTNPLGGFPTSERMTRCFTHAQLVRSVSMQSNSLRFPPAAYSWSPGH